MLHGYRGLLKNYSSPAMTRLSTIYCGKAWSRRAEVHGRWRRMKPGCNYGGLPAWQRIRITKSGVWMVMESAYVVNDGVAVVLIDNPPVNSLSAPQRQKLSKLVL